MRLQKLGAKSVDFLAKQCTRVRRVCIALDSLAGRYPELTTKLHLLIQPAVCERSNVVRLAELRGTGPTLRTPAEVDMLDVRGTAKARSRSMPCRRPG